PAARGTDHPILSSRASSAASLPPVRRPNHASRFEGIAKTNLQASTASDTETLQSQVNKAAKKRLSLSELEILHGRLDKVETSRNDYDSDDFPFWLADDSLMLLIRLLGRISVQFRFMKSRQAARLSDL